ncbi:MAG: hypothetical protein Q7S96_02105 [bacterium]|nr:hypothetical protein [bacterium]
MEFLAQIITASQSKMIPLMVMTVAYGFGLLVFSRAAFRWSLRKAAGVIGVLVAAGITCAFAIIATAFDYGVVLVILLWMLTAALYGVVAAIIIQSAFRVAFAEHRGGA